MILATHLSNRDRVQTVLTWSDDRSLRQSKIQALKYSFLLSVKQDRSWIRHRQYRYVKTAATFNDPVNTSEAAGRSRRTLYCHGGVPSPRSGLTGWLRSLAATFSGIADRNWHVRQLVIQIWLLYQWPNACLHQMCSASHSISDLFTITLIRWHRNEWMETSWVHLPVLVADISQSVASVFVEWFRLLMV